MIKDRIWTLVSRKLSGEATLSELSELNDLIRTQANADVYLQAIDEYWKIPTEKDEEFLEATYHLHLNRLKEKGFDLELNEDKEESPALYLNYENPATGSRKKWLFAAGVFGILAIAFAGFQFFTRPAAALADNSKMTRSEVSTKSGSRTNIQLPDGSSVWLNGGSKLVYDNRHFGDNVREVTLTGEGYFDIVKNKEKPFILHANKLDIKVLGTAFNVRAYPGEKNTEASLIRGSIEVSMQDRREKIMMQPNDKLIVSNDELVNEVAPKNTKDQPAIVAKNRSVSMSHLTLARDESTIVETAWVENKLVFDKESFEDVASKMERWYGVSIHFSDETLKLQKLTGTFEKETVTEALNALRLSTPFFKYSINNQNVNIFR